MARGVYVHRSRARCGKDGRGPHDLTADGARMPDGRCRACYAEWLTRGGREKNCARQVRYRETARGSAMVAAYRASARGRRIRAESQARYAASTKGQLTLARFEARNAIAELRAAGAI